MNSLAVQILSDSKDAQSYLLVMDSAQEEIRRLETGLAFCVDDLMEFSIGRKKLYVL